MKNKKLFLAVIALIAVGAVFLGMYTAARPETAAGEKAVTVTVVHKNGESRDFSYRTEEAYLGPVLLEEGLVRGEEGQYGLMIHTVDEETADWNVDQSYWALYVGEEYATSGADTIPIHDGDVFRLEYTLG